MAILERPRLLPQERFDLEDLNALLSAIRTDFNYWHKRFFSGENHIVKGFNVSGIGLKAATVNMANATLIIPESTTDFSWFTSESGASNITITDAELTDNARNYIELELVTDTGTPVTKAFWDPSADGGNGAEFNQTIDTVTYIEAQASVRAGGFSGDPDKIPLCYIDTDATGDIVIIVDKRELFFRLGTVADPSNDFTWVTQQEPILTVALSGGAGTYSAGETVTFATGATATVVTGGTTSITIKSLSNDNIAEADALVGSLSGANRNVDTVTHSFTGGDTDIDDYKEWMNAVMTEIKALKGTDFWYQSIGASISGAIKFINSIITQNTSTAKFGWTSGNLNVTDDNGAPADVDIIGLIRLFGSSQVLNLTRQDGTGGSSQIAIADGEVMYITLPNSGNRTYSGTGSGSTNYKVVAFADFSVDDFNYWLAFREGNKLFVRGLGELEIGEEVQIGDQVTQDTLTYIGANDETDNDPNYSSVDIVTQGNNLTDAISELDAAHNFEDLTDTTTFAGNGNKLLKVNSAANAVEADNYTTEMNIGSSNSLDASSVFDLNSTTKGSRPAPRMTTVQRVAIVSPVEGLLVYDTDTNSYWYYDTLWIELSAAGISSTDSITAFAGGGQGSATQLTTTVNRITTCASAGDSVKLSATFNAGDEITVINDGTERLDIFPSSGDFIEGMPVNTAIQLLPNQRMIFRATTTNSNWRVITQIVQEIQDFTAQGSVGSVGQQQMGRLLTVADLEANLSNCSVLANYKMTNGDLTDDETTNYDLTNNNVVTDADGISGSDNAAEFNGTNQSLTQSTLIDTMPSDLFMIIDFKADDGIPASQEGLLYKENNNSIDDIRLYIDTDGTIVFSTEENGNGAKTLVSSVSLINGVNPWIRLIIAWDSTIGKAMYVQGNQADVDIDETTLMANGTFADFTIGALAAGASGHFDGKIGQVIVCSGTLTPRDVDYINASSINIPAALQGTNFEIEAQVKDGGEGNGRQSEFFEVDRVNNNILKQPFGLGSTDELKLIGRKK